MAGQLLGQIANPQMADIAGALDYRQKKMQEDEARRKEIKFQQIAGKALSTGLKEGSILHELAMNDPARYLVVAKSLGVDPSNGAEGMSVVDDISSIYGQTVQGVENGLGYVESLIKTRGELGLDTSRLQALYDQGKENPTIFKNTIDLMQKTFNPSQGMTPYQSAQLDLEKRKLDLKEKGVGETSTSDQKNWETYQKMKTAGDPGAESFGRASGFVGNEGEKLSAFSEKQLAEASDEYTSASSASNRYLSLSDKLEKTAASGGLKSTWTEFLKEQTGNQDEITALRKEALQISNSEAIKNLPPGPATDRDIEIAKAPFPTEKASPEYVASWLKAMANLNQKRAEYADFKAQFISKNGTLRTPEGVSLVQAWKESQKQQGGSGKGATETTKTQNTFTGQDKQAFDWAKSNPSDPRASAILKRLGVQ